MGQLFLWCARVLSEAADLQRAAELGAVREAECGALVAVLDEAQQRLERLELVQQRQTQPGVSE